MPSVPDRIIDALIGNLTLTTDVGELDGCVEKLAEFSVAGLSSLTLGLHDNPHEAIRLIGERVVPALRSL